MSNDRINKNVQDLGYCCAFCFFYKNNGKRDSHKRLADKADVGVSTIQFNRRKIRNGQMGCAKLATCQLPQERDKHDTEEG
jgi:hypothetical protein